MAKSLETVLSFGVIGLILLMIVPVSPFVLDLLLSFSLVLSVLTLLLTLHVKNASEFSSFPSLLLFLAFFRLGLNIASARMILTKAEGGDIIATFGKFVSNDSPFIGFVLFIFLMIINFIVITKGSGRIAEVAARFVLEGMPGKQLAIDSDLNSHSISHEEAKNARKKIASEAEFYGAMDGASKFVRGEAIASLLITGVNILGALFVGSTVEHGNVSESIMIYLRLAIGDGLVSQIPALIVSLGAGVILTKVSNESLIKTLPNQIFSHPKAFLVTSVLMLTLGFIPGMPKMVLLPLSALLFIYYMKNTQKPIQTRGIELIFGTKKEALLRSFKNKKWGQTLDFLPDISMRLSRDIDPLSHQIKIHGVTFLNSNSEQVDADLERVIQENCHQFINRQYVAEKLEEIRGFDAALVTEILSKKVSFGLILTILQNLLKEGIPINDFHSILSVIADNTNHDPLHLTEAIRKRLSKGIFQHFFGDKSHLHAITLDPDVEEMITVANQNGRLLLRPKTAEKIEKMVDVLKEKGKKSGVKPAILTSVKTRVALAHLLEKKGIPVFSFNEISEEIEIKSLGIITNDVLI